MHEPYLALYIADKTLHFEKKLPTEETSRGIIEVPLDQVVSDPLDEAARKLGATVLGLFKLWHKKEFEGWDDSVDSKPAVADFTVALYLIDWLSQGASEDRLCLIDEILGEAAKSNTQANDYLQDDWPALRKRLLQKPA
jgi:hypothetical protein